MVKKILLIALFLICSSTFAATTAENLVNHLVACGHLDDPEILPDKQFLNRCQIMIKYAEDKNNENCPILLKKVKEVLQSPKLVVRLSSILKEENAK